MEFAAWRTARQLAPRLPAGDAVALWALFKQATEGDCPTAAAAARGRRGARRGRGYDATARYVAEVSRWPRAPRARRATTRPRSTTTTSARPRSRSTRSSGGSRRRAARRARRDPDMGAIAGLLAADAWLEGEKPPGAQGRARVLQAPGRA